MAESSKTGKKNTHLVRAMLVEGIESRIYSIREYRIIFSQD